MLKTSFIAFLTLFSTVSFAQREGAVFNPNLQNSKSVNLYAGAAWWPSSYYLDGKDYYTYIFEPAFQWSNKNSNFHEIGMNSSVLDRFGGDIELQYDYTINFMKHRQSNWIPAISLGAAPYFLWNKSIPVLTNDYPASYHEIGVRLFVQPRLTYYFSKNLFINLNIPVYLAQADLNQTNVKNPGLPIDQQKSTIFDAELAIDRIGGCIGIGWKF